MGTIRVLVVDDSTIMRRLLTDLLQADPEIEVIDTARDGQEAIDKAAALKPDVITLDIEMPRMDGLTALHHIMREDPRPVVMVSAMDKREADITMKALAMGAVDFVSKTSASISLDMDQVQGELITKVKGAARARVHRPSRSLSPVLGVPLVTPIPGMHCLVIGASTGGPGAITKVVSGLPRNLPAAVLVVVHMPAGFTGSFAQRLNWFTSLEVREAEHGDSLVLGRILVAPGGKHLRVRDGRVHLDEEPPVNFVRPSVDVTMETVAREFGKRSRGVLLTGMGADGANGLKRIKEAGGPTIAQDEDTSIIYGMPKAAVELGAASQVLPLESIAAAVVRGLSA